MTVKAYEDITGGPQLPSQPPAQVERRKVRPALVWATLGVLWGGTALAVFTAWFVSGDAERVPTGPDPLPRHTEIAATLFQISSPVLAALTVVWVVRKCLRERRMVLDAMIVLATSLAWWHDPLINWMRPIVFYNATLVNLGSWTEQVPGWISPGAKTLPEPILMIGCVYVWMSLCCAILACGAMRKAQARWPQLGSIGTFAAGYLAVLCIELPMEIIAVHSGLLGYPSAAPSLTLWAGTTEQLPVYGPLLWTASLTSLGWLRYRVDAAGRTTAERGIDRLRVSQRVRTVLSTLAIVGYVHTAVIVIYDIPINFSGMYAGETELYPSYLRTQQCGPEGPVACPGPTSPIVLDQRP